jgi:hypothetical protein
MCAGFGLVFNASHQLLGEAMEASGNEDELA